MGGGSKTGEAKYNLHEGPIPNVQDHSNISYRQATFKHNQKINFARRTHRKTIFEMLTDPVTGMPCKGKHYDKFVI